MKIPLMGEKNSETDLIDQTKSSTETCPDA